MSTKKPTKKPAPKKAKTIAAPKPAASAAKRSHSGLGKGLGALIDAPAVTAPKPRAPIASIPKISRPAGEKELPLNAVRSVPVTEIQRSPWQPRQTFDDQALQELADSIVANGIIQPLVCRKLKNGRFELIGGERRLRASMLAKLTHVPVILVDAEDRKAAELAIVENIQRADLNVIEEAEGFRTLADTFKLTQVEVAERVGKARASITNALRLLDLPDETKQMVADGRLSAGHAKVILGLPSAESQIRMARRAVNEALSVRAIERAVASELAPPTTRREAKVDLPKTYLRDLTDKLHAYFGAAVRVNPSKTLPNGRHAKGVLEVDFFDNDDLSRILEVLGVSME